MFTSKYQKRLGVCIDTAHIFAGGVDVSKEEKLKIYLKDFNRLIGTKCIKLFHINDSQKPLNSRRDLHANIGQGYIFDKKFSVKYLVKFASKHNIPLILETKGDRYKEEIDLLKHYSLDK
jgi:endonuclease IV